MARQHGNIIYKTVEENRVNVITTAWTALRAGTSNLPKRQEIFVFNRSSKKVFFSTKSDTPLQKAFAISGGEFMIFPLDETITLYGRSHNGSAQVIVWEYA